MMRTSRQKYRQMRRKHKSKGHLLNNAGFTLSELLMTVGILVILMAFGFIAIFQYQKSLKLMEMDATAKQIFVAAQNHMTAAKASGEWDKLAENKEADVDKKGGYFGTTMEYKPDDFSESGAKFEWPKAGVSGDQSHHFYSIVYTPDNSQNLENTILKQILPFGAIDGTVREGSGSYVIEYDYVTASVYGVFYTDQTDETIAADVQTDLNHARGDGEEAKKTRKTHKPIIGYYGGAAANTLKSAESTNPKVSVDNEEMLVVNIKDVPADITNVTVYITGEESKNTQTYAWAKGKTTVPSWWSVTTTNTVSQMKLILDDITSADGHFYTKFCDTTTPNLSPGINQGKSLIPGENITVRVKYSSTSKLMKITTKDEYTNSLFEANYKKTDSGAEALSYSSVTVSNLRHLQNLDPEISGVSVEKVNSASKSKPSVNRLVEKVLQTKELDWEGACKLFAEDAKNTLSSNANKEKWPQRTIYNTNGQAVTAAGTFCGVINKHIVSYDGQGHRISNLVLGARAYGSGDAKKIYSGVFPVIGIDENIVPQISSLLLIDTTAIEADDTKSAATGALVGCVYGSGANISNVGVYLSSEKNYAAGAKGDTGQYCLKATTGDVGGLIGSITDQNNGKEPVKISDCFASVPVKTGSGTAGGLVGAISRGNTFITNSYSGGYTVNGTYQETAYNVNASGIGTVGEIGTAGGFIGSITGNSTSATTVIQNSFSTCSVNAPQAGGFIGLDNTTISSYTNCYSAGKVTKIGTNGLAGCFAGSLNSAKIQNCYYMTGLSGALGSVGSENASNTATIKGQSYAQLQTAEFIETTPGTKPAHGQNTTGYGVETHNYDTAWDNTAYPFATVNTTAKNEKTANKAQKPTTVSGVYYGDWTGVSFEAELAYYEIYLKDDQYTLGLYNRTLNVNSLIENPDDEGYDIVQDGYVSLTSEAGNATVSVNEAVDTNTHGITAQDNSIKPEKTDSLSWTKDGQALNENQVLTDDTMVIIKENAYYLQFWDLYAVDAIASSANFYSQVKVSFGGSDCYFYCNPHYAMSAIQNCGADSTAGINPINMTGSINIGLESNPVVIRTERQYSMMTQDLQNPTDDENTVYARYRDLYYMQTLDLTFGNSSAYVAQYFDQSSNHAVEGGVGAVKPVVASANTQDAKKPYDTSGFRGVYNGKNHAINNLTINNLSGTTTGMFGNTQGALIENLILNNITLTGTDYVGSVVGSAAHATGYGSKKVYTVIENVTVKTAVLNGKKYVGGLVGAAFSCSVNTDTNNSVSLSGLNITGDSVIGSVIGMIQTWGTAVKGGYHYQNISVTGENKLYETITHSTSYTDAGIGGFAGEIKFSVLNKDNRKFNFKNIHIAETGLLNIYIAESSGSNRIYGGLFIGNLYNDGASGTFTDSFTNCKVSNTKMYTNTVSEAEYDTHYAFGGLIGNINQKDNNSTLTISLNSKLAVGENCGIHNIGDKNPTGKSSVGGLVGNVSSSKIVLEQGTWNTPSYTGFTADNTVAYGGLVGTMMQNAIVNCEAGNPLQIVLPDDITANSIGGLVGRMAGGSSITGGCQVSSITGTVSVSSSIDSEDVNIGGVIGLVDVGVTLTDLNVNQAMFGCQGGTNVGIGGAIGKSNVATIKSSSVDNLSLSGNADYVGGFIGIAAGTTITNCDVHSSTLETGSYSVDEDGQYVDGEKKSSPIAVTGQKQHSYVGGLIGSGLGASISDCFSAIPVKGTAGFISLGGLIGVSNGCMIEESYASGNILNYDYSGDISNTDTVNNCSFSGGFSGIIEGNSSINDCYATGIVKRGTIIGGFVGDLPGNSIAYLNNTYSVGAVDQQIGQGSQVLHGGFMGRNCGSLRQEPLDLNQNQVGDFYDLLELDLTDKTKMEELGFSTEDQEICETCYKAMKKRKNMGNYKTIAEYLIGNEISYNIDSTAATRGSNEAQIDGEEPSVSAVVQELFKISKYQDIRNLIKTWRLTVENKRLYFYYSVVDIENLYTTDEVEAAIAKKTPYSVIGYQYEKQSDGKCYQTKGILTLTTAKITSTADYGNYVQLKSFTATDAAEVIVPDTVAKETYTGCTYLREDARGYNASSSWNDSSDEYVQNVSYRDFDEFTDANGAYLKLLNTNLKDESLANRFTISKNYVSHTYDSKIAPTETYPFPAFVTATGNTTEEVSYWGDWPDKPEKISDDIGLIYYEKVNGSLYYHGFTANFSGVPSKSDYTEIKTDSTSGELKDGLITEKGKHVAEDGYLVLLPKNSNIKNLDIQLGNVEINQVNSSRLLTKVESNNGIQTDETLQKYDLYFLDLNETTDTSDVFDKSANTIAFGYADHGSFNKYAEFRMTPYFADSIQYLVAGNTETDENIYKIRTVRQMGMLVQKEPFYGNEKYTFIQKLDLDYTANDFTNRGTKCTYQYLISIKKLSADYKVEKITDEENQIISGYDIKGIGTTMFKQIAENAKVSGITLIDAAVSDVQGGAFAEINKGTIASCSVRPSGENYSTVKVSQSAKTGAAGFIWENNGTIKDSSFIGTVELSPKSLAENDGNEANLSGFAYVNTGTIENSYTNCILNFYATVPGKYYTAGFCQSNSNQGAITSSHAISKINYFMNGELSAAVGTDIGFVKLNGSEQSKEASAATGEIRQCYSVCNGITSKESYAFIYKNIDQSTLSDNYYLKCAEGTFTNTEGATEKNYAKMKAQAEADNAVASKAVTHPYAEELSGTAYPFSLPATQNSYLTTQHYGDWPKGSDIDDVGLLYYETVDNKLYYHGYTSTFASKEENIIYQEVMTQASDGETLENGLVTESGKYVTKDGYLILVPKGVETQDYTLFLENSLLPLSDFVVPADDLSLPAELSEYTPYELNVTGKLAEIVSKMSTGEGLVTLNVGQRIVDTDNNVKIGDSTFFSMTPYFADSIVNQKDVMTSTYIIRSAGQLNNLKTVDGTKFVTNQAITLIQKLDIDFARVNETFETPINRINAKFSSATYKDSYQNKCGYVINGLESSLFTMVGDQAEINGITLTDVRISDNNIGGGFATTNNGTIESCSIRPSGTDYSSVRITKTGNQNNIAGFVGTNNKDINNCSIIGTVEITNNGIFSTVSDVVGFVGTNANQATITNCYVNGNLSIDTTWGNDNLSLIGFCKTNLGIIEDSHAISNMEIRNGGVITWLTGEAFGFVKENVSNNGTINNCYSVITGQMGIKTLYTFAGNNNSGNGCTNCYYLSPSGYSSSGNYGADEKTYQQMQQIAIADNTNTSSYRTHRYTDSLPDTYPFALPSTNDAYLTMQHYGDWPEKPAGNPGITGVGLVYYEKVGGKLYYHGYSAPTSGNQSGVEIFSDEVLPSEAGQYVEESGYLLLTTANGDMNSYSVYIDGKEVANKAVNDGYLEHYSGIILPDNYQAYKIKADEDQKYNQSGVSYLTFSHGNDSYGYTMTPYFGDSVSTANYLGKSPDSVANKATVNSFNIRSIADLLNLEKYSGFTTRGYSFIQKLDIDASTFNLSIDAFSGNYYTQTYQAADGNIYGYSIDNIQSGVLFDKVKEGALLDGITLTNVITNQSASLALENSGTIQNCTIRTKEIGTNGYSNVTLNYEKEQNGVAGFIYENKATGVIKNCAVIGTVSSKFSDASGFVMSNAGTIENCYANCLVTAEAQSKYASGFCGNNSGTIQDSHALMRVTSKNGVAYGFAATNTNQIRDSYAAMKEMSGTVIYPFADGTVVDSCRYLNTYVDKWLNVIPNTGATGVDYVALKAGGSENTVTKKYGEYFTTDMVYPFALNAQVTGGSRQITLQHYGDWPDTTENDQLLALAKSYLNAMEEGVSLIEPIKNPVSIIQGSEKTTDHTENANQLKDRGNNSENTVTEQNPAGIVAISADIHTGIAYYENNNQGYEGWYAITDNTSNDEVPYNTLTTEPDVTLADHAASYGILITKGVTPECTGASIEKTPSAAVNIDGMDYDYYKLITDEKHEDVNVNVQGADAEGSAAYSYNDDFAAAISAGKTLGQAAEEGGRPYQIRTNAQLRSINANKEVYLTKTYRQTLDIALTEDNFEPVGGVSIWTKDSSYSFSGSYDAGLIREGRDLLESSADESADASAEIPAGYHITGLNQTITFTSVDGNDDRSQTLSGGLFANVSGTIRGVNVSGHMNIMKDTDSGSLQGSIGSVVGQVSEQGLIANTNSDVSIHIDTQCIDMNLGGMAGYNDGHIQNSYYSGSIQNYEYDADTSGQLLLQNEAGYTAKIGGFAGYNTGSIDQSSSAARINLNIANVAANAPIYGGFVGLTAGEDSFITNSWNKGVITGGSGIIGGFAGSVEVDSLDQATSFTNDYSVVRIENPAEDTVVGLFIGQYAVQDHSNGSEPVIWSCFAAELNAADQIQKSTYPFLNGIALDIGAHNGFIWNSVENIPFDALNVTGAWNLNNGIYPTLNYNVEREQDTVKVQGAISKEQDTAKKEPETAEEKAETAATKSAVSGAGTEETKDAESSEKTDSKETADGNQAGDIGASSDTGTVDTEASGESINTE